MSDHVYTIVELVGSSHTSIEDAIGGAVGRANETLRNLDWFEVKQIRGSIQEGKVAWYQVALSVGFRLEPAGSPVISGPEAEDPEVAEMEQELRSDLPGQP